MLRNALRLCSVLRWLVLSASLMSLLLVLGPLGDRPAAAQHEAAQVADHSGAAHQEATGATYWELPLPFGGQLRIPVWWVMGSAAGGFILSKLLDELWSRALSAIGKRIEEARQSQKWRAADKAWGQVQARTGGIQVIQSGWRNGAFEEEAVQLTLEGKFKLSVDIQTEILNPKMAEWARVHKNETQIGLAAFDASRSSDEVIDDGKPTHQLRLRGHSYSYFEMLATNATYREGALDRAGVPRKHWPLISQLADHAKHENPVPSFANPLSVGLALFCEGGRQLILCRRTEKLTSGGLFAPGLVFNAVGENVNAKDYFGMLDGVPRISPLQTALRGLHEEMGIDLRALDAPPVALHSFVFDAGMRDYKFFGSAVVKYAISEVIRAWELAPDKHENRQPQAHPVGKRSEVLQLLKWMHKDRAQWSNEAVICTIRSLLFLGKAKPSDVVEVFGK